MRKKTRSRKNLCAGFIRSSCNSESRARRSGTAVLPTSLRRRGALFISAPTGRSRCSSSATSIGKIRSGSPRGITASFCPITGIRPGKRAAAISRLKRRYLSANNAYVAAKLFHRASLRVSSLTILNIIFNPKAPTTGCLLYW